MKSCFQERNLLHIYTKTRSKYMLKMPELSDKGKFIECFHAFESIQQVISCFFHHLASSNVTVTLFTLHNSSCFLEEELISGGLFLGENPGFLGCGISGASLFNIKITEDIVGLSSARSWTHNSPICMQLRTSDADYESLIDG